MSMEEYNDFLNRAYMSENKGFLIYCFHDIFFPLPLNVLASLQKKRKLLTDLVQDFRLTDLQQHIVT